MFRYNSHKLLYTFFIFSMGLILFSSSCKKEEVDKVDEEFFEISELMNISISGTIVNEDGEALEGVMVSIDDYTVTSNDKGIYSFQEINAHGPRMRVNFVHAEFHTVFKSLEIEDKGRFHQNTVMIGLGEPFNFSASSPNKVIYDNIEIDFQANSFIDVDGNKYAGNVNVYTKFFDPTTNEFASSFPSSMEVLDDKNEIGFMQAFSGVSVVLLGENGEQLEINENAKVRMKVPNELLASAPSSLSMGHYNEELRIWQEQTSAELVGGFYETELNHFSSWCCYIKQDATYLNGYALKEIIDINFAEPLADLYVEVKIEGTSISGSTRTSGNGYFGMKVPKNIGLELNIYANSFDQGCGDPIYVENISPLSTFYDLGNLFLGAQDLIVISGTAFDCNQSPLDGGFVFLESGSGSFLAHPINSDGSFTIPIYSCAELISLVIYDIDFNYSSEKLVNLNLENDIILYNVIACEVLATPPYFMKAITGGDTIICSSNNGSFNNGYDTDGNFSVLALVYFKADILNTSRPLNEGTCSAIINIEGVEENACEVGNVEIFIPLKDSESTTGYLLRAWPENENFPNTWTMSYNCIDNAEYLHFYGRGLMEIPGQIGAIITHRNPEVFYDIYFPL